MPVEQPPHVQQDQRPLQEQGEKTLFYDKTNVHYISKGKNHLFNNKMNVDYRIKGKDAFVIASMGNLTSWQHWMTMVTTRAR